MAARTAVSLLLLGLLALVPTWGVTANVEVNMEDRVEVSKGETAAITCMFKLPVDVSGVIVEWLYVKKNGERQKIFYQDPSTKVVAPGTRFTDRISVNGTEATGATVMTVSHVQPDDQVEFICSITDRVERSAEGLTKLKVFAKPDHPTIDGVKTGFSINEDSPSKIGTCEVKNGFPKPNITWYRNKTPVRPAPDVLKVVPSTTLESSGLFSVSSELFMKVVKEDKDDLFYCEINYFVPGGLGMTETVPINITVYYPSTAVKVWVESPKGIIREGDSVELQCQGNGNMPSSILTFRHKGREYASENDALVLHNVTRQSSGVYECISMDTDTFEEILGNGVLVVNYLDAAVVLPEDTVVLDQGGELTATCNALSSLQTQTAWMKYGEKVSSNHSLILENVTYDSAGTYLCVVNVEIEGMETTGTLDVKVQGPPQIMKSDHAEMEESAETTVDLRCSVRGFPTPSVIWTTADGKILKTTSEMESEGGVLSVVSIKVTSDITAFCNASNHLGTDSLAFNIKAKGTGVIIAVVIIGILLLAVLGSVLYFLYKKGKICGRSGKQDLTKEKSGKDNIVVEMKNDNTEEAVLLGVNGEKQTSRNQ
ncbi:melanoma cell adhesion molecule b isoform 4-T4 [Spinachia spinachia]